MKNVKKKFSTQKEKKFSRALEKNMNFNGNNLHIFRASTEKFQY